MSSEYDFVPKSGKLKLKGIQDQKPRLKIEKKKKQKKRKEIARNEEISKKSDEEEKQQTDTTEQNEQVVCNTATVDAMITKKIEDGKILPLKHKTEAQLRCITMRQKQQEKFTRQNATKSYQTRIHEYNMFLQNMSDHNSQARVKPIDN